MRVAFFEPEAEALSAQSKGALFERLARRLAEASGYRDVTLRKKHRSLEYDLEGVSKLQGVTLLGEAKAHEATISGKDLSGFVGKFLPKALTEHVEGLFISTSAFTAEASDYLDGLEADLAKLPMKVRFRTLVGDEITDFFAQNSGYASEDVLRQRLDALHGLEMLDAWLVVTERSDFFACSCGPNKVSAPTAYALFKTDGTELALSERYLERLERQMDALEGLESLGPDGATVYAVRSERLPSVVSGAGWFDYKFPTPPDCFIGRRGALDELRRLVESVRSGESALRAAQVLSRSGVGKSSLLVKLPTELERAIVTTVDGRNLRAESDTRLLVGQVVEQAARELQTEMTVPAAHSQVNDALRSLAVLLRERNHVLVVQVDQFESTLPLPPVFNGVLDLVETTTSQALPIAWIFARKNDLATTYDASAKVRLSRLNDISVAVALHDFSPEEGRVLLDRLQERLGQRLQPGLAESISAFSSGFPWLHKRLCAHVLSAVQEDGISQRDLVQTGLRPEDLFEEDLAGLDEQDKALLRRIAAHLPTTGGDLARQLEAEVSADRLTGRLNEFLGLKLLRRSGDIYDTYNDVFKTYLISETVPFESRYVFRVQPGAAMKLLTVIQAHGPGDLSSFHSSVGGSRIALLNKLRELRLLGLIEPKPGRVALAAETQSALDNNDLGELLRKRLRANALVLRVLDLLATEDDVAIDSVVAVLQRELPHVEAAGETWRLYARTLASWLHFSGLAQLEGERLRRREIAADASLVQGRAFSLGAFAPETFLPSSRPADALKLCELLRNGSTRRDAVVAAFSRNSAPGLIRDCVALDLVVERDGVIVAGRQARALLESGRALTVRDVAHLCLSKPSVRALLDAASPGPLSDAEQIQIMKTFGSAQWKPATWAWRLGMLRGWLVATGQVRTVRNKGLAAV